MVTNKVIACHNQYILFAFIHFYVRYECTKVRQGNSYVHSVHFSYRITSKINACHWKQQQQQQTNKQTKCFVRCFFLWHKVAESLNCRPVSNLPFLSKNLGKVVPMQLTNHMTSNHFTHNYQSTYRAGHCKKAALLPIVNDTLTASDANQVLSWLSLTIDHSILLCRLEQHLGVSGLALS